MQNTGHNSIAMARAAIGRGQFAAAEALVSELLRDSSEDVDALEILFLCQQARQHLSAAEATLRRVLLLAPHLQWPRGDLARLLLATGHPSEAEDELRAAVEVDDGHADAHALLGCLLSERGLLVLGACHLERATALAGPQPQLLVNLGRNLMRQGKLEEAEPLLQAARAAAPQLLVATAYLAELAEQRDQFDRAAELLDHAAVIARGEGRDVTAQRAHLLSRTPQWREGLALLDAVLDLSGTPLLLRARLRDRAHRYREAWTDAIAAKAQLARTRAHVYDSAAAASQFSAMAVLAERMDSLTPAPVRQRMPQPIFILGFPRSGTTMTEQVLASHRRIRPGGELPFVGTFPALVERLTGAPLGQAVETLTNAHKIAVQLRDFYLEQAEAYGLLASGADYFTDKMPLNEAYLPLIRLAFPQAPLIAVHRDPRDVMVSVMQHDMTHGFHCTYRLHDAAAHFAAVSDLAARYRVAGIVPYSFRYASFVADQAAETERLMTTLGLTPEPAQADFHESRRHAPTPSYAQVREPLHDRAVGRWRNYQEQLSPVATTLAPAVARADY